MTYAHTPSHIQISDQMLHLKSWVPRWLTSGLVTGMFSRLQGQPESYERKAKYKFGKTLGAGTYGIVREADGPQGKVAIKIILKKNVKGNERMVWDELDMLQRLHHPHIVRFVDWFESRVSRTVSSYSYSVSLLSIQKPKISY